MASYEKLADSVSIHISPCPEAAIMDATRHVIREFCKETKLWVHDCPKGVPELIDQFPVLNLEIPDQTTIIHLWGVKGRIGVYQDDSQDYYLTQQNILVFNSPKQYEVSPLVSLMPSMDSNSYPDFIYEYFSDGIVSGIVAYLQMQPHREWSQPNAAGIHLERYQQTLFNAKQMRDRGLNISKTVDRVRPCYM